MSGGANAKTPEWHVVEAISNVAPSVISCGGKQRQWTSVDRIAHPACKLRDLIAQVVETGSPVDTSVCEPRGRQTRVIVIPIDSAKNAVYGVQVWVGPPDVDPPEPRKIAGVLWDLQRRMVIQTYYSTTLTGYEDDFHEEVPLARVLQLGSRYDEFTDTLQLLFDPQTGQKTQTYVSAVHFKTGKRLRFQITIVAVPDVGVRVMWEDVTDTNPPETPTLHQLGMSAAAEAGLTVAVLAPSVGTFALFLTPPPDWMPWSEPDPSVKILHPDDQEKIVTALNSDSYGRDDNPVVVTTRLLSTTGQYVRLPIKIRPMPGAIGSGIVIATFSNPTAADIEAAAASAD